MSEKDGLPAPRCQPPKKEFFVTASRPDTVRLSNDRRTERDRTAILNLTTQQPSQLRHCHPAARPAAASGAGRGRITLGPSPAPLLSAQTNTRSKRM
eukprot:323085-Hanusia_phi.AAC.1